MKTALMPLAPGCEELEAVTLIDILRRGGVNVVTASLTEAPVKASRGVVLTADALLASAMQTGAYDMVVIPGGMGGTNALLACDAFLAFLKDAAAANVIIAAICAAPLVLGKAGLLDGRRFTAYPGVAHADDYPGAVYTGAAVEMDGAVLTSRGPGTAVDFALQLVETLVDAATRHRVEKELVRA